MWRARSYAGPLPPERRGRRAAALGILLAAAALLCSFGAEAQPFRYTVELEAPEAQRRLLETHLEIYTARGNPRMNADQLRLLLARTPDQIRELLATEGYYSPSVEPALEERNGAWITRLKVSPGEPSSVAGVKIELRGAMAENERSARLALMRERLPLREGMVFRQAQWEASKRAALQILLTDTFPAASVASSQATVDPRTRRVSLQITLESGPAFSFGHLEVSGLQRYPRSIVERLSMIEPGSAYSQAKVLEFQSRLQDSRYFSSALVSTDIDPEHPSGANCPHLRRTHY